MGRKQIYDLASHKFSFTVDGDVKKALDEITKNTNTKYGPALNKILNKTLLLSSDIKKDLIQFFKLRIKQIDREIQCSDQFAINKLQKNKADYNELIKIFNNGKDPFIDTNSIIMNEIQIQEGVLIIPNEWIVVNPYEAKKHKYAAVLECRNSKRYGIPHFIMHCDFRYEKDYTDEFIEQFIDLCCKHWPDFKNRVLDQQIELRMKSDGKGYENEEEYLNSPIMGFFRILESDDEEISLLGETPYGSQIIRC